MTTSFPCPDCGRRLEADEKLAGAKIRCGKCGSLVSIPQPAATSGSISPPSPNPADASAYVPPVWLRKKRTGEEHIDMTPMIDCVFQLLIFFLVTAAFSLQKSIEMPIPDRQDKNAQPRTIDQLEADPDLVIVRIDKENTIWVEDAEAPSEQDLLAKLRKAREGKPGVPGPRNLLVLADGEARHDTVVMALDAGNAVGMETVRLATVDEEDF